MSNAKRKNCDADVSEMRKLFQQTKFKAPGGEEGRRKFIEFYKKHNPEAYQKLQELSQ